MAKIIEIDLIITDHLQSIPSNKEIKTYIFSNQSLSCFSISVPRGTELPSSRINSNNSAALSSSDLILISDLLIDVALETIHPIILIANIFTIKHHRSPHVGHIINIIALLSTNRYEYLFSGYLSLFHSSIKGK